MERLAFLPLVLFLASSCDVFVSGVGGEGEPCFGDGTCNSGLSCNASDACIVLVTCPSCVSNWTDISGGTFNMGSNTGESDEKPVHSVAVPSFDMMKTEVTVSLYRQCVDAGACTAPDTGSGCNWGESGRDEHPVNCVDWNQAFSFCQWAGGRLPTESEWEYAARSGGQNIMYPWGDDSPTCSLANYSGCEGKTWAVCNATAGNTSQGLCDMAGNVWEWVQDWYHDTYNGAPTDGSAWEFPSGDYRVLRGGSWYYVTVNLRASGRNRDSPDVRYYAAGGFRCGR